MLSKKVNAKKLIEGKLAIFNCPLCESELKIADDSLVCLNRHTFNITRKGIVNFVAPIDDKLYDATLFRARRKVINSNIYTKVLETLENLLPDNNLVVVDAGCGEGSYLNYLSSKLVSNHYIGLDLAKAGLNLASDYYRSIFLSADLAKLPLKNNSVDVLLNILSPANYVEFKRTLKPEGILIKVIPNSEYLKELNSSDKNSVEVVNLLKRNMEVIEEFDIKYLASIENGLAYDVNLMSPLNYHSNKTSELSQITIDLKLIIAKKSL